LKSSLYYHLAPDSNNHLKLRQKINQGELIGKVGSSGQGNFDNRANGTGIHLHFEMWSGFDNKGRPINIDFSNHFPELNEIPYQ
jgi:murein DD-endopeptidase MepM/ murein hydrolase activator NlpD